MNAEYEKARRLANNTIAEANRHLESGKIKDPRHHQMLTTMVKEATDTVNNIDAMENRRMYSDSNIGYTADARQRMESRGDARGDTRSDAMRSAMDAIGKILPHISNMDDMDDMDDTNEMEARRGVRGTGRGRGRTRVRGYTRRADTNDAAEMAYNNGYDDARYEHEQRMNDAVARAAADAATATARRMTNEAPGIYPGTPVMPHDARGNANTNARNDADTTSDRMRQAGPGMER